MFSKVSYMVRLGSICIPAACACYILNNTERIASILYLYIDIY